MNNQLIELTADKLREIYTNEKFRNQVATAHTCLDRFGNFKHMKTCSYPVEYIVTEQQINEAKKECERAKTEAIKNVGNKLVFVGMGMRYESRYKDDVCNWRIRTEFKNDAGHRFFIELSTLMDKKSVWVQHSIDRTLQDELNDSIDGQSRFYNYAGLERSHSLGKYTKSNILRIVNKYFGCSYTEIEIDNYNLRTEEFICSPPKKTS